MSRRYLSFDIETAKLLPEGAGDIKAHRPLGIACAATWVADTGESRTWCGQRPDGTPAPHMSREEAAQLVHDLAAAVADGYTLLTWNGLSFDFDILAEESGEPDACRELATGHVDMMFHAVCELGHFVGLAAAAEGMGLPG
ncbi:MAG: hypothetical protein ACYTF3_13070, partial [Planctomycetota bacterium]